MRKVNGNIIIGSINTFRNGWDSGFPLCCILEFVFKFIFSKNLLFKAFLAKRKVYDRDAGEYHNEYCACHLCYWRGLADKPSKLRYVICKTCDKIIIGYSFDPLIRCQHEIETGHEDYGIGPIPLTQEYEYRRSSQ